MAPQPPAGSHNGTNSGRPAGIRPGNGTGLRRPGGGKAIAARGVAISELFKRAGAADKNSFAYLWASPMFKWTFICLIVLIILVVVFMVMRAHKKRKAMQGM